MQDDDENVWIDLGSLSVSCILSILLWSILLMVSLSQGSPSRWCYARKTTSISWCLLNKNKIRTLSIRLVQVSLPVSFSWSICFSSTGSFSFYSGLFYTNNKRKNSSHTAPLYVEEWIISTSDQLNEWLHQVFLSAYVSLLSFTWIKH